MEQNQNVVYVEHPLIKEKTVENRLYQQILTVRVLEKGNTLVVAPTGLGKTVIAALVAAERLRRFPEGKVLILAPTKPLAVQHAETFRKIMKIGEIGVVTGSTPPEKREKLYKELKIIAATPQTIENDLLTGRLSLEDFVLVVFDEAHRAVGNYSYVYIAKEYMRQAKDPLILAMTASPGGDPEKVQEVVQNLFIKNIEIKTPYDPDVRPYVHKIVINWREVELHPKHLEAIRYVKNAIRERLRKLKEIGLIETADVTKYSRKDYLALQGNLAKALETERREIYWEALSLVAQLVKLDHALELLEAQGTVPFISFVEKIKLRSLQPRAPKADKALARDENLLIAYDIAKKLAKEGYVHSKVDELKKILHAYFKKNPDSKAIVFVQYRDTASYLVEVLSKIPGVKPVRFVGQASKGRDKGLSQKEQKRIIEEFREGKHNVLVATSVAEEGLDIPAVDLVVFYEPVPSEIRWIQRRGRTGRFGRGTVVVLVAKGTRDEAYYWAARIRERKMLETLRKLKRFFGVEYQGQRSIFDFVEAKKVSPRIEIIVDHRERGSDVFKLLVLDPEVRVSVKELPVADYVLSDRVAVERKSFQDLVNSIIDGRLFTQARELVETYPKPVIVVEGRNYTRKVHPNAVRGAIASLAVDYGIPVIFTEGPEETYQLLKIIAKREQVEKERLPRIRGEKRIMTLPEMQRFIVESLPTVGPKLARELLRHFKTVERVFTASERELASVEGIGEKRAKEIRRVLTAEYREEEENKPGSGEG